MPLVTVNIVVDHVVQESMPFKLHKTFDDVENVMVSRFGNLSSLELRNSQQQLLTAGDNLTEGEEYKCKCVRSGLPGLREQEGIV